MLASAIRNLVRRKSLCTLGLVLGAGLSSVPVDATPYVLTYTGTLHAADSLTSAGGPDLITTDAPFVFSALFDTATPNIVAPLPKPGPGNGFVAYVPSQASFSIGGVEYALTGLGSGAGPTIAIYDQTNIFMHGRYGVGLIVNPLADGAGFIGDFMTASPDFSVATLGSTSFENFAGAGFSAGLGCGPDPAVCTFQPIALANANRSYALQFAGTLGAVDGTVSYDGGIATAVLTAVPEPETWTTMMLGLGALGFAVRQQRRPRRECIPG